MRYGAKMLPMVLFLLPSGGIAQSAEPTGRSVDPATLNLASCIVARSAGDLRWLLAVASKKIVIDQAVLEGVVGNSFQAAVHDCPVEGASMTTALQVSRSLVRFHPNAVNATRENDALGSCLANTAKDEALAYLQAADKAYASKRSSDGELKALLSASKGCGGELTKLGDRIQANQLYSRMNWLLRAEPALGRVENAREGAIN